MIESPHIYLVFQNSFQVLVKRFFSDSSCSDTFFVTSRGLKNHCNHRQVKLPISLLIIIHDKRKTIGISSVNF